MVQPTPQLIQRIKELYRTHRITRAQNREWMMHAQRDPHKTNQRLDEVDRAYYYKHNLWFEDLWYVLDIGLVLLTFVVPLLLLFTHNVLLIFQVASPYLQYVLPLFFGGLLFIIILPRSQTFEKIK